MLLYQDHFQAKKDTKIIFLTRYLPCTFIYMLTFYPSLPFQNKFLKNQGKRIFRVEQ
jgi:hypothetical protein